MDTNGKKLINNLSEDYCSSDITYLLFKYGFNVKCLKPIPTHALAIKWIRENFGFWACSYPDAIMQKGWYFTLFSKTNTTTCEALYHSEALFKTSEEATEAAILYTLENLI